jgi:hypothetical protein
MVFPVDSLIESGLFTRSRHSVERIYIPGPSNVKPIPPIRGAGNRLGQNPVISFHHEWHDWRKSWHFDARANGCNWSKQVAWVERSETRGSPAGNGRSCRYNAY